MRIPGGRVIPEETISCILGNGSLGEPGGVVLLLCTFPCFPIYY